MRWIKGSIYRVPLAEKRFAFCWLLESPLAAFFHFQADESMLDIIVIVHQPIAFKIWIMGKNQWEKIGQHPVSFEHSVKPWFVKKNPYTGEIGVLQSGVDGIPPVPDQIEKLEHAMI